MGRLLDILDAAALVCTHACTHSCTHAYTHVCTSAYAHAPPKVTFTHVCIASLLDLVAELASWSWSRASNYNYTAKLDELLHSRGYI